MSGTLVDPRRAARSAIREGDLLVSAEQDPAIDVFLAPRADGTPADTPPPRTIDLSVVIPAFNEQSRIADTLYAIKDYLSTRDYTSEIIVVDDGSTDLTAEVVRVVDVVGEEFRSQKPGRLVRLRTNHGKGYAVAQGFHVALGRSILFTDADLSTPIDELDRLFAVLEEGHDVVIGSRHHADSVTLGKPLLRRCTSGFLALLGRLFPLTGVRDSQCGFKLYRRHAALALASLQRSRGFSFDLEHLYLARALGYRIQEVGVRWEHRDGSKVRIVRDGLKMLLNMVWIRIRHRRVRSRSGCVSGQEPSRSTHDRS